jgi:hypothetical protein
LIQSSAICNPKRVLSGTPSEKTNCVVIVRSYDKNVS